MALNYNQLATNLRKEYPGKYDNLELWSDEDLARRFISIDPSLKDYVTDWKTLYSEQESKAKTQQEDIKVQEDKTFTKRLQESGVDTNLLKRIGGIFDPDPSEPHPDEYKNYVEVDPETGLPPLKEERASHFKYVRYQMSEQFSGIPEWFIGSTSAFARAIEPVTSDRANVAGFADQLGALAEEMRAHSAQQTEDYLAENPDIVAYLKWMKDEPVTLDNWWHEEIFNRGLAQAAPTVVPMIFGEVALC